MQTPHYLHCMTKHKPSRIDFLTQYERDTGKVITKPSERAAALALDKLIAALKGTLC